MRSTIRLASGEDADAIAVVYRPYVEFTVISFEIDPGRLQVRDVARRGVVAAEAAAA
jgi:L-amino acid N-acyltransferase YncA